MSDGPRAANPLEALREIAGHLRALERPFALVGGLAVSVRSEVRFTRDVDIAVDISSDSEMESLVRDLSARGYRPVAVVEQEARGRIATARLRSRPGVVVDLLAATTGIEPEIVARATGVRFEGIGDMLVARAEELLAMKVLSMTEARLQDRIDAMNLILESPALALDDVRSNLALIEARGYHREQDLIAKLDAVLASAQGA